MKGIINFPTETCMSTNKFSQKVPNLPRHLILALRWVEATTNNTKIPDLKKFGCKI